MPTKQNILDKVREGESLVAGMSGDGLFKITFQDDLQHISHLAGKLDSSKLPELLDLTRKMICIINKTIANPKLVELGEEELQVRNRIRELLWKK